MLNPRRTGSKKEGVRRSGSRPHGTLRHRKPEDGTRGVVDERDNDEREKRREETTPSTASTTRDFEERREEKREREERGIACLFVVGKYRLYICDWGEDDRVVRKRQVRWVKEGMTSFAHTGKRTYGIWKAVISPVEM